MEQSGEEVDGSATDVGGALVDAGDFGVVWIPAEGDEPGLAGWREGFHPGAEIESGLDEDVGSGSAEPGEEGIALAFAVTVEQTGGVGGSEGVMGEEGGGPGGEHALVEDGGDAEADALEAKLAEFHQGGEHALEMVMVDPVKGWGDEAEADDDGAESVPGKPEVAARAAAERGDEDALDAAMGEDADEGRDAEGAGANLKGFEAVAQTFGALVEAGEQELAPTADGEWTGGFGPDEGEGGAGAARLAAGAAQVSHEAGDFGVGGVAHLLRGLADAGRQLGLDVGSAAERAGDGHFGDAQGGGEVGEGDGLGHDLLR